MNKEEKRLYDREYAKNNKEKIKIRKDKWYQDNKEEIRLKRHKNYIENKDEITIKHREYRLRIRREVMKHINHDIEPLCVICGEEFFPFLQIDHVNNDGAKWGKIHGVGDSMVSWLRKNKYPEQPELQILCANCNMAKATGALIC